MPHLNSVASRLTALRDLRLWLAASAALLALAAAAALQPFGAVHAAPPDDISLELSLVDDSDNVVPVGSRVTVRATLKYTGAVDLTLPITASSLFVSGDQEWETLGRNRFSVANQELLGGAFGPYTGQADGAKFIAMDGRTLVIGGSGASLVHLENPTRQPYAMRGPTGRQIHNSRDQTSGGFTPGTGPPHSRPNAPSGSNTPIPYGTDGMDIAGSGTVAGTRYWSAAAETGEPSAGAGFGRSVAVWHENENTAWVFVGSKNDTVNGHPNIGRLYIYKVVYDGNRRTVTLERNIEPQPQDYMNHYAVANSATGKASALFGSGVAISANGKFLAVAAAEMNLIGAVYVYERPGLRTPTHGPGSSDPTLWQDWGDLTQNSAAKLTQTTLPDWDGDGDPFQTTPGGHDYDGDGTADGVQDSLEHWRAACTAVCQRIWSYTYSDFGKDALAISEDGLTIVVGAEQKQLPESLRPGRYAYYAWPGCQAPPNSCTPADYDWAGELRNGEAYVYTPNAAGRAAGYWRATSLEPFASC